MKTCLIIVCLAAVGSAQYAEDTKLVRLSQVSTDFAQVFLQKLPVSDSNSMFSGYSIFITLCNMVYGASRSTETEMYNHTQIYRFTGGQMKPHEANRYVLDQYRTNKTGGNVSYGIYISLNPGTRVTIKFDNFTKTNYKSEVAYHNLNDALGPERIINDYFKNKTGDVIKDIVPPGVITSSTQIVLASAFQFSAIWDKPFDKTKTHKANFTLATGQKTEIDMMFDDHREATYLANFSGAVAIEIPFLSKRYSMVCVLPPVNRTLADQEKSFAQPGKVLALFQALDDEKKKPQLTHYYQINIPKFKIQQTFEVSSALRAMGMNLPFEPMQANFTSLSTNGGTYISKFFHKVDFQINENGTAPITGAPLKPSYTKGSLTIQLNRPFLMFIIDTERKITLFQGRYTGK